MKKYLILISTILIITSCDIEEGPFITDYNAYVNPEKKVLIEDFTGHLCPNCPDAAEELEAIKSIYPDQIIGLAIHVSTTFARPYPASQAPLFQYDFRTQWGDEIDNYYAISDGGLPKGMINRIGFPENHKLGKDEWSTIVANELKKEIDFKIYISSDSTSISIISESQKNNTGDYNLIVCLAESNIINYQKDGQTNIDNYSHNHVLRSVLIDQQLSNTSNYIIGQEIETSITYNLDDLEQYNITYSLNNTAELGNGNAGEWNADNMSVIAYIYNNNTKEIIQVEEAYLNN